MTWSVLKNGKKGCNQEHLFQVFTQEEWDAYPFADEEKMKWFKGLASLNHFIFSSSAKGYASQSS